MSTNFNLAMLRNLHEPVSESLDAAIVQLAQYAAGTMDPSTFSGAHHAHLVNGSLSVIGCRAAARVADLLEQAMGALPMPQTRGWSDQQAIEVARVCQGLASQLLEHINRILSDMEDLPVRMWPAYRDLHQHLSLPTPASPEDLYEPDPNFQNLKFAPLSQDYLSSVVKGAISRLRQAIEKVDASSSKQELETGLQSALKVFDWVYSLRHARGYQAYWLALSARISVGLLDQEVLGDKGPWSVLLGEALIELEKFARNNRRVDPELLGKTVRPLVARWPGHWAQSHPTLAETNERLGISLFWDTLDEVESVGRPEGGRAGSDMPAILEQLKLAWGRYVVGEGSNPAQVLVQALEAFRKAYPETVLSHAGADALMNSVMSVVQSLPQPGDVSDAIAVEFAAAVLLLEDALDGRGRQATIGDSQSSLQRRRLHASLNADVQQLASLPCLRWDDKKHERMLRAASCSAFAQVQKDISEIEEALVERLRDDHVSLDMAAVSRRANQAAQVLEILDAKPAATISTSLVALVERVDRSPGKDLPQAVTLGIAALDTFLSARQAGDGEATHLLAEAYHAITGEPMPYGYATEVDTDEVKRAAHDLLNKSTPDDRQENGRMDEGSPAAKQTPSIPAPGAPSARYEPPRFDPAALEEGCAVARTGQPTEAFFLEEMEHVLAEIAMQRGMLSSDPSDDEARQTLRRQFHTIKGSSRIAGFDAIGHAAERVERYLDAALLARPQHAAVDEGVVSRAVEDMKGWFVALSGNQEAWVSAQIIQAWFDGANENAAPAEDEEVAADAPQPIDDATQQFPDPVIDDVEIVSISGYGSMEYEAYYSMTEDLQKSLGLLDDLASASADDAIELEEVEGSLRGVMDIGESMGAPALARLPRAMLENAQASMSRTGPSSSRLFATPVLSRGARELGAVIRNLSENRKMSLVDADLLHALQSDTDFLRDGASVVEGVRSDDVPQTTGKSTVPGDFMAELTQGMESDYQPVPGPATEEENAPSQDTHVHAGLEHIGSVDLVSPPDTNAPIDGEPGPSVREAVPAVQPQVVEPAEQASGKHIDTDPADGVQDAADTPEHVDGEEDVCVQDGHGDTEEDALWEEVFDNFEQISACMRKIGPLLVSLSERGK